jgi:hypothetical protein
MPSAKHWAEEASVGGLAEREIAELERGLVRSRLTFAFNGHNKPNQIARSVLKKLGL